MTNVDPGTYFATAPLPTSGAIIAEFDVTLPDGSSLTAGFTFPAG
jgi:hypothetical protein